MIKFTKNISCLDFRSIFAKYYLGFAVYVSNTTNRNDGVLCYKDRSYSTRTLPDRVTIRCLQTAQYVIYYNERRRGVVYDSDYSHNVFGDLCEVEVYGISFQISLSLSVSPNSIFLSIPQIILKIAHTLHKIV